MTSLRIRPFREGDEEPLHAVFYASVHGIARARYSPEQLAAWAPERWDRQAWAERLGANRPFVAELDGVPVGFADLQPDGYIDQIFVSPDVAGEGVGGALMRHLLAEARKRGLSEVYANVSLNAQPFFRRYGFQLQREQAVTRAEVTLVNGRMVLALAP